MAGSDVESAISDMRSAAFSQPDLDSLRAARALLAGAAFKEQLAEIIDRSHNQPNQRAALAATLMEVKFAFRDQLAGRTEQHSQTGLVAIGGGVALSIGAILAAATQFIVYPSLAILPLAAGIYYGWNGLATSKRLALEKSVLNDS